MTEPVAFTHWCNKCGWAGKQKWHTGCSYFAAPLNWQNPAPAPASLRDMTEADFDQAHGIAPAGVPDVEWLIKVLNNYHDNSYSSAFGNKDTIFKKAATALAALQAQLATLATNKDAVRVNLLRGTLARPDDLLFMHDTNGPYAQQAERIKLLESDLTTSKQAWNHACNDIAERDERNKELKAKLADAATLIDHLGGSSKFIREVMG